MGDVTNIPCAIKGQSVMFTESQEVDWAFNHLADSAIGLTSALCVENLQHFGVAIIAFDGAI
jgi:hypothetical protein